MKKVLFSVLIFIFVAGAVFGFILLNKELHTHSFNKQKTKAEYIAFSATCAEPAKYYYSCACGEKGTKTFTYGNALGHSFTNYVSDGNATSEQDGTKTAKCDRCDATDTVVEEGTKLAYSAGLEYNGNTVTGIGICTDTNILIPKYSPEGNLVTSIGGEAFKGCSGLKSVTIPDSVTTIGGDAFV